MKDFSKAWKKKIHPDTANFIKASLEWLDKMEYPSEAEKEKSMKLFLKDKSKRFKDFYLDSGQESNQRLKNFKKAFSGRKEPSADDILFMLFALLNMESLMSYEKPIRTLFEEAKAGEKNSLLKLLRIDKSLFDHAWVRRLMFKEMLLWNETGMFFEEVGDAIKSESPIKRLKQKRLRLVLILFWHTCEFEKLSNRELIALLEDSGMEVQINPETFRSFVNREIKPIIKQFAIKTKTRHQ